MKRVSYEDITLAGAASRGISAKKMARPVMSLKVIKSYLTSFLLLLYDTMS
jgi:hypothetical protein